METTIFKRKKIKDCLFLFTLMDTDIIISNSEPVLVLDEDYFMSYSPSMYP